MYVHRMIEIQDGKGLSGHLVQQECMGMYLLYNIPNECLFTLSLNLFMVVNLPPPPKLQVKINASYYILDRFPTFYNNRYFKPYETYQFD